MDKNQSPVYQVCEGLEVLNGLQRRGLQHSNPGQIQHQISAPTLEQRQQRIPQQGGLRWAEHALDQQGDPTGTDFHLD